MGGTDTTSMQKLMADKSNGKGKKANKMAVNLNGGVPMNVGKDGFVRGQPHEAARHEKIAQLAYFRAEQQGFGMTDPVADWLWAEKIVDEGELPR